MSYFGFDNYFGPFAASGAGAIPPAHNFAARHELLIDDVYAAIFAEFPEGGPVAVFEGYSDLQDHEDDALVVVKESSRYILQNEETIDVRFTGQARGSRDAEKIVLRAVEALERHPMTQVVRRDGMDHGYAEELGFDGPREVATQIVEVR